MREVLSLLSLEGDEIFIHFVTIEEITSLHGAFFQDPTPTDCITFPIDLPHNPAPGPAVFPRILGEVFICPKVAMEYAPTDPFPEVTLYIIHTLLHLKGYDDQEERATLEMRSKERELLTILGQKNLVLSNPLLSISQ